MDKTAPKEIVILGAGIAGLLTAYQCLSLARAAQLPIKVIVLSEKLDYPCAAGSHIIGEVDGFYMDEDIPPLNFVEAISKASIDLIHFIQSGNISCRLNLNYEIKSKSRDDLETIINFTTDRKFFKHTDIVLNTECQSIKFPELPESCKLIPAGQINAPEFLTELIVKIKNLGGDIVLNQTYLSHDVSGDGRYKIVTSDGVFYADFMPVLATGALHQHRLVSDRLNSKIIYTMGCVFAPNDNNYSAVVELDPVEFCDTNLHDDVLWGGIDPRGFITLGMGASESIHDESIVRKKIETNFAKLFPDLVGNYNMRSVHWGATLHAPNSLPIVGRLDQALIVGGWGGVGIVPAFAAAQAVAQYFILEDDSKLKVFEPLQPVLFPIRDL